MTHAAAIRILDQLEQRNCLDCGCPLVVTAAEVIDGHPGLIDALVGLRRRLEKARTCDDVDELLHRRAGCAARTILGDLPPERGR